MTRGAIIINDRYVFRFKMLAAGTVLIVKIPAKTLVTNVKIQSISGRANTGISDSYMIP